MTIEMAGTAFPTEGRGLDTWALILIGLGGAALLWIIVSQATIRLSGAGTGTVRPQGAPTPLGAGAQLDFGIEAPAPQPAGSAIPALQTTIGGGLRTAVQTIASLATLPIRLPLRGLGGVLRLSQVIGTRASSVSRSRSSQTIRTPERPTAPPVAPARPATAAQREPVVEQVYEEPVQAPRTPRANPFAAVARLVGTPIAAGYRILASAATLVRPWTKTVVGSSGSLVVKTVHSAGRLLSSAASTGAWVKAARLIARIALEIGKRLDVGVLAYLISLPLLAVMALLLLLKAVGVGIGLGQFPVIIIAIGAGLVFIFTRIRRSRSGNIRRAERAAEALDEDRA